MGVQCEPIEVIRKSQANQTHLIWPDRRTQLTQTDAIATVSSASQSDAVMTDSQATQTEAMCRTRVSVDSTASTEDMDWDDTHHTNDPDDVPDEVLMHIETCAFPPNMTNGTSSESLDAPVELSPPHQDDDVGDDDIVEVSESSMLTVVDSTFRPYAPVLIVPDGELCAVQSREILEILFKPIQHENHEFLYQLNMDCIRRKLTPDAYTCQTAVTNCTKQKALQDIFKLDTKSSHLVQIHGERPSKLVQLKCSSWQNVQILLQVVKRFNCSTNFLEPGSSSIFGRLLFLLFVNASKMISVSIENVQKDGRTLHTVYDFMTPTRKRRATDRFELISYDGKRPKIDN